jgi:type I site-specific restriction endonuclease
MRGVILNGLTRDEHGNMKSKYTASYKKKIGNKTIFKQMFGYEIIKNDIIIYNPAVISVCIKNKFDIIDKRIAPIEVDYKCRINVSDNQAVVYNHLLNNIFTEQNANNGIGSCVLVMATGMGKTYTSGKLISGLKVPTLIIVPKISILNEWMKMFKWFDGEPIGRYFTDAKEDGNIVVMTIESALNDEYKFGDTIIKWDQYFTKFGLVIYDEVHNYPTNKYKDIFWRTNFKYRLGLTATPDERTDKMDIYYKWHLNTVVHSNQIEGWISNEEPKWTGTVIAINYYGPIEYTHKLTNDNGWLSVSKMVKQFSRDIYRNKLITNTIDDMLTRHRNVYIFSEHRDYIIDISAKYDSSSIMMGGITDDEFEEAKNKSVIFITYGYGKEGISIPKMNAIVFAHPRKSKMNQIIGRILRMGGDENISREIVDIIDYKTSLKSQFSQRKEEYTKKGFNIVQKNIKYTELRIG